MAKRKSGKAKTIQVRALARVEGEGAFTIVLQDDRVADVKLEIYEPPRFYEAFMRGRQATEAPDITARICGICPVAYQMSAVRAIEKAYGIQVPEPIRSLRRLLYCGEWIESHVLHMYLLHAPDFFGYESAIAMAQASAELKAHVERGLRMKKIGNAIVEVVGGRAVHPINVRVGGFYRAPTKDELQALVDDLRWGRDAAIETARWVASLDFPDFTDDYEFACIRSDHHYAILEGDVVTNRGLRISEDEFLQYFREEQVPYSHALHSRRVLPESPGADDRFAGCYQVGPLARWNLNRDVAPDLVRQVEQDLPVSFPTTNPFHSIVARALEVLLAYHEAIRIIEDYEQPDPSWVPFEPRAGHGCAITEAPRGMLYHEYHTDDAGYLTKVTIIPPTSQNQLRIEKDLYMIAPRLIDLPQDQACWQAEFAIRNYDPCISCATHFLKLKIERLPTSAH